MCGRADDVVDGADVVALLLLIGAEEAVTLLDVGRGAVDVADDGEGLDVAEDVDDVELAVSTLRGADAEDGAAALVIVDDVGLDVEADTDADVAALLASFLVWASVSFWTFILALLSAVEDASVVTVEDAVPVVADEGAPLASSSEPK